MQAQWIWYPGDYELYHSLLLHDRRQEYGADYPCFWQLAGVYPRVNFYRDTDSDGEGYLILHVRGNGYVLVDEERFPAEKRIRIPAGRHHLEVVVLNHRDLPSIYVESDIAPSDGSWLATPGISTHEGLATAKEIPESGCHPVGCHPVYASPEDDVTVFPFSRERCLPTKLPAERSGMTTYDFGKEMFGSVHFRAESGAPVTAIYGESFEEATAYGLEGKNNALVYETVEGKSEYALASRAFRYVSFLGQAEHVWAEAEMLPLEYRGDFSCSDPLVKRVYDVCAYTFHLCARELLLDAIKRDRWCWGGDAYLSYIINAYLFGDEAVSKRTMIALYGKPPYTEHINTINDYTALTIIGTWEYLFRSGDVAFLRLMWNRICAMHDFVIGRLRGDGYVVGRANDWVFVDWSEIDKTGAVCAEQILLWEVEISMANMAKLLGADTTVYLRRAETLRANINRDFWSAEQNAYIDSFESGKNHVTRHANIFAVLFDFCDAERAEVICRSVLENDRITAITTPYFKTFELMALCKLGRIEIAQELISSYWGGMLALGASSIWEEFDPTQKGAEHYRMYGSAYGKSLCHAWGGGPIAFLGKYCAGVQPTSIGSATFVVEPNPGMYREFTAKVPLRDGLITVNYRDGEVRVTTDLSGGTLRFGGKELPILPGKETVLGAGDPSRDARKPAAKSGTPSWQQS